MAHVIKKLGIVFVMVILVVSFSIPFMLFPSKVYADVTYEIGDNGPAGGKIFYKESDGAGGWNYLEASLSDQSTAIRWNNGGDIITGATAMLIGTGFANTNAIINAQGAIETSYAAGLARAYTGGGKSDWFLPSRDELSELWANRVAIGGFNASYYWSSSETSQWSAWIIDWVNGDLIGNPSKAEPLGVRAIRAFSVSAVSTGSATPTAPVWVRTMPMTCYSVWVNYENKFQFIFWYPYRDNNWVRIYDLSGKMVYEIDMPYNNPNLIVDLPDGMYTVKTFTVGRIEPIQTFIIGK